MWVAIISGTIFLATYLAVNRGLGENPFPVLVALVIAVGLPVVLRLMSGGRSRGPSTSRAEDFLAAALAAAEQSRPSPPPPSATPPPRPRSGGGARKLF